jgi:hypothetical protein
MYHAITCHYSTFIYEKDGIACRVVVKSVDEDGETIQMSTFTPLYSAITISPSPGSQSCHNCNQPVAVSEMRFISTNAAYAQREYLLASSLSPYKSKLGVSPYVPQDREPYHSSSYAVGDVALAFGAQFDLFTRVEGRPI